MLCSAVQQPAILHPEVGVQLVQVSAAAREIMVLIRIDLERERKPTTSETRSTGSCGAEILSLILLLTLRTLWLLANCRLTRMATRREFEGIQWIGLLIRSMATVRRRYQSGRCHKWNWRYGDNGGIALVVCGYANDDDNDD